MANNDEGKPFKVEDRRRFTDTGEPREAEAAAPDGPAPSATEQPTGARPDGPAAAGAREGIDFLSFVFSLGSSVLMYLGDAPNPETGQVEKNLAMARETIDVLAMLQEKTKGNLTPEEDRFLGSLLYDLRLRFVEANK